MTQVSRFVLAKLVFFLKSLPNVPVANAKPALMSPRLSKTAATPLANFLIANYVLLVLNICISSILV